MMVSSFDNAVDTIVEANANLLLLVVSLSWSPVVCDYCLEHPDATICKPAPNQRLLRDCASLSARTVNTSMYSSWTTSYQRSLEAPIPDYLNCSRQYSSAEFHCERYPL